MELREICVFFDLSVILIVEDLGCTLLSPAGAQWPLAKLWPRGARRVGSTGDERGCQEVGAVPGRRREALRPFLCL